MNTEIPNSEIQCECCKSSVSKLTPRYVATKKKILNICDACMAHYVTYEPSEWIEDGDTPLICETVIETNNIPKK
jgi:hypothetical protein